MNVTKSTETRTVNDIRYVGVKNMAVLDTFTGADLLSSGLSQVKVTKLAKGGYSVRPIGPGALGYSYGGWSNGIYHSQGSIRYVSGTALLRVDGEQAFIAGLFS